MSSLKKYPGDLGVPMAPRPQKPFPSAGSGALMKLNEPFRDEAKAEWKAWIRNVPDELNCCSRTSISKQLLPTLG